jgi:hypothetical protein
MGISKSPPGVSPVLLQVVLEPMKMFPHKPSNNFPIGRIWLEEIFSIQLQKFGVELICGLIILTVGINNCVMVAYPFNLEGIAAQKHMFTVYLVYVKVILEIELCVK